MTKHGAIADGRGSQTSEQIKDVSAKLILTQSDGKMGPMGHCMRTANKR
jgi:hypothetical protein